VRELRGVLEREKAALGVLITMREPTRPMRAEAASAGLYTSPGRNKSYPRLQLLTVRELLAGKGIDYPPANVTFRKAPKAAAEPAVPLPLPLETSAVSEAAR
jgi:site-specific DNA-methyltransferase (adenine-specific)